jgi:hypothetical protein
MTFTAQIGPATTLLELAATSIGAGIVVAGFIVASMATLSGRSRREVERNPLRDIFLGGVGGICCLTIDLILRYAQ